MATACASEPKVPPRSCAPARTPKPARKAGRRHPLATVALLAIGLGLTGGAYAAFTTTTASADTATVQASSKSQIEQGEKLFQANCATCHGMDAQGTVNAPSLIGVGAAAVDFQVGTGRMPMQMQGPQAEQKPVQFSDQEVAALAAYVASLGPGPAIPSPEQYDPNLIPEDEREEAVVSGGEFFRTNCTACHNFAASGGALPHGRYAPPLLDVEPRQIYNAMLTGPQQMPVFSDDVLTPEEKRAVIALSPAVSWLTASASRLRPPGAKEPAR